MSSVLSILDDTALEDSKESVYGQYPKDRDIETYINNGFILLDKPAGPTSHEIVATVKKILHLKKAGHSGTLDPNVTGVLPIGLENATKALTALKGSRKRYICNLQLQSNPDGEVFNLLHEFEDAIYQVPPLKSNVAKKLRTRRIHDLTVLDQDKNNILLDIFCDAGTYIRTLCVDIGRASGYGGYMKELRRTETGPYREMQCVTLHQVFDAYHDFLDGLDPTGVYQVIQPVETMVEHLPKIVTKDNAVDSVCHGAILAVPGISAITSFAKNDLVAIMTGKGELVALGRANIPSDQVATEESGRVVQPSRVLMKRGSYPKYRGQS